MGEAPPLKFPLSPLVALLAESSQPKRVTMANNLAYRFLPVRPQVARQSMSKFEHLYFGRD